MNLMKTKLEKEIANHAETRKQLDDLINSFHEAKIQVRLSLTSWFIYKYTQIQVRLSPHGLVHK